MGRSIFIRKTDQDCDTVFYRFGPGGTEAETIATVALDRLSGVVELVEVDDDAALRLLNEHDRFLLERALRRVRRGRNYPERFSYSDGLRQVDVFKRSEDTRLLRFQVCGSHFDAIAEVDPQNADSRFVHVENCRELSQRWAEQSVPYVTYKLQKHLEKGELPDATAFISG